MDNHRLTVPRLFRHRRQKARQSNKPTMPQVRHCAALKALPAGIGPRSMQTSTFPPRRRFLPAPSEPISAKRRRLPYIASCSAL